MDADKKEYLRNALRHKRKKERFNQSLAREVSKKESGRNGYKIYVNLMNEVRDAAEENGTSNEKAVKSLLKKG